MRSIAIPVKTLARSKLRLSEVMTESDRVSLSVAMLEDVLDVVGRHATVFVVTSDTSVSELARSHGCISVRDPGRGLDAALEAAIETAAGAGSKSLLILPGDVPLILEDEFVAMLEVRDQVALVSSSDGGTNALMMRPPGVIPTAFGPDSAAAHMAAARAAGVAAEVLDLPSIAFDVDSPADLAYLAGIAAPRRSVAIAQRAIIRGAEVQAP